MTGAAEFFEELRREYLTEAPARLGELRKDLAALTAGEADAAGSLKGRFHRLAGSGGSYGFPDISSAARAAEQWLVANPRPDQAGLRHLEAAIAGLAAIFDGAARAVGLPATTPPGPAAFGWRALVVGSAGGLIDAADQALQDARYTVDRKPLGFDPADVPVSQRHDLVVIAGESGSDLEAVVASWGFPGPVRPGAVVLIAPPEGVDPLAQPYASLDLVVDVDDVDRALLGFARELGRAATAPRSVLLIDPDAGAAAAVASSLEGTQVRTVVVPDAKGVRAALTQENWDAVISEWRLPDTTAPALIRWIRHHPHHRLTPILVVAKTLSDDDRLAAIRAGADDALPKSGPAAFLIQTVQARIDRSRTIRAAAHRDDLTGLLNHEALVEELDRAVSLARRAGETVALLTFDIDHLRRINEQHGQSAGDAVLVHVARKLAATVRSSDLVARMGGEEFAALIRRCRLEDAVRLANKIRTAVAEAAVSVGTGEVVVRISGGVACYPDHGASGVDVLRAADRALTAGKGAGRDRVAAAG